MSDKLGKAETNHGININTEETINENIKIEEKGV